MSEYYRVRTQEQWGWLMKWFEEQDENIKWSYNDKPTGGISDLLVGILLKRADIVVKLDNFTLRVGNVRNREAMGKKLIEVSDLMEGEKMEEPMTEIILDNLNQVIPEEKYWVKCYPTDDCYFYKYDGKILAGVPRVHLERFHFTAKEITDYHLDGNTFEKVEVQE